MNLSVSFIIYVQGLSYLDKTLSGTPRVVEEREEVVLAGWTDRVYLDSPAEQELCGGPGGRLVLSKTNLPDTVVWNPWQEKAEQMGDLGGEHWSGFICVEAGQCVEPVILPAGQTWAASHTLAVQKQ